MPKAKQKKKAVDAKITRTPAKAKPQKDTNVSAELSKMVEKQFTELSAKVTEQVNLAVAKATEALQIHPATAASSTPPKASTSSSSNVSVEVENTATPSTSTNAVTPEMTLQGVVQSLLQANQPGEISHIKPEATFDIPLGAALPQKIREKVLRGEFVDLYTILFPHKESQQLVVNTVNGANSIDIRPQTTKSISSIDMWTSAMMTYGAVYLSSNPDQAPKFLKYVEFIRSMQRNNTGWGWKTYDEVYRRTRVSMKLDWDQPLVNQYFSAISSSKYNGKPFRRNDYPEPRVPKGYCVRFHTRGCKTQQCKWKHQCFRCNANHAVNACTTK